MTQVDTLPVELAQNLGDLPAQLDDVFQTLQSGRLDPVLQGAGSGQFVNAEGNVAISPEVENRDQALVPALAEGRNR